MEDIWIAMSHAVRHEKLRGAFRNGEPHFPPRTC